MVEEKGFDWLEMLPLRKLGCTNKTWAERRREERNGAEMDSSLPGGGANKVGGDSGHLGGTEASSAIWSGRGGARAGPALVAGESRLTWLLPRPARAGLSCD